MSRPATSISRALEPKHLRFVTAASLFDGHDASINIMRRMLQAAGVEVIHLGHNRSVAEVVDAAIQEDAHGIAISSYQGGHVEYFQYMIDSLRKLNADDIRVFGGGGGVIVAEEIDQLHAYGVEHVYSVQDGQSMGLEGMIDHMIEKTRKHWAAQSTEVTALEPRAHTRFDKEQHRTLAKLISLIENDQISDAQSQRLLKNASDNKAPVLGITGTGGAGKSSVTDELIRRLRLDQADSLSVALLAIDPSRRKSGGALLGDRIRMNAINHERIFMRSLATRDAQDEVPETLPKIIAACRSAGVDLIIVETPGIGQGDAGIVSISDVSLYVMTPDFGAASQLEKIDMLDFADVVCINKFERKGGEDALRDVRKQVQRNRKAFAESADSMPVYGSVASMFNDDGITALYQAIKTRLAAKGMQTLDGELPTVNVSASTAKTSIVPSKRQRYLAEISESIRTYHEQTEQQSVIARQCQQLHASINMLRQDGPSGDPSNDTTTLLSTLLEQKKGQLLPKSDELLSQWPSLAEQYQQETIVTRTRGVVQEQSLSSESLSGTRIPKVSLPRYTDHGDLLGWLRRENLPGYFPFTAGVFPFKRSGEDPTRMFAGEGGPHRTNKRFKKLSAHAPAKRLSTAFDSVTLYGNDPALRPDIYGKVGNSGVSIATVEDMQALYAGFDLCDPATSVSMTINGPAPTILAFYFIAAVRQKIDLFTDQHKRAPEVSELSDIRANTYKAVRGTVQADILKEDQGQNTCIFSTEFSLKMMADIQQWFIDNEVHNFYSVSISGYHIAEAGANPISQLAFTLANGFTYVESYLARGMDIDDFAPNLSFFFSNGMDPEYTVMGRVARRIWAVAMHDRYGANERSQKLKYHIQTSGRSLHAQEMAFNDIRTTLQALIAIYDNCNSLHTNAYDEAITTPTDESVRRAMAIQLVINKEWGLANNENPNQGSFVIDELTDLVEEAVLQEFERIADRGGVLGAMETGYQRGKIQDESMLYEHRKHDGSLPIIGVNTFLPETTEEAPLIELARSSDDEKQDQINRLADFQLRHKDEAPAALQRVRQAAINGDNVFAALIDAAEYCSLGQLTNELFTVGGQYRRNM